LVIYGNQSNRMLAFAIKASSFERLAHAEGLSGKRRLRQLKKGDEYVAGRDY